MSSIIKVGKVQSSTGNDAVTIANDGTITANGAIDSLKTDTISEKTSANGVSIDGVKLKDSNVIIADGGNIGSASDTDAISISSGGYVIRGAHPYFRYRGAGDASENITNGSRAEFDVEVEQRGTNYNASSYFFLTPVAGMYYFGTQLYTYNNTGNTQQWRIASENTSDADEVLLTTHRITSATIGDILQMSWVGYVPANRRISVRNSSSGTRNLYMSGVQHSQWFGALIG